MAKFQIGDLVKHYDDYDYKKYGVMRVLEVDDTKTYDIHCALGNDDIEEWYAADDLELVLAADKIPVREAEQAQVVPEQTVAIVSFRGAVERECKRIVDRLSQIEELHNFRFEINVTGKTSGKDVEVEYLVGKEYGETVRGNTPDAVVDEFMRRHGWEETHQTKAIAFQNVPS